MPRIWLDYCQFLQDQCKVSRVRRTFDRALRALPISQHHRIWPHYLKFARAHPLHETAVRIYRRYLKVGNRNMKENDRLDEGMCYCQGLCVLERCLSVSRGQLRQGFQPLKRKERERNKRSCVLLGQECLYVWTCDLIGIFDVHSCSC